MAGLKAIKRRIASVTSTQQVTRVMKMVAAAKLRRAQENIIQARPYALRLRQVIRDLSAEVDRSAHPLLAIREPKKIGLLTVSGDRGLAGGFNANILKKTRAVIEENSARQITLFTVGKKSCEFFSRRGANIAGQKQGFFNHLAFADAVEVGDMITAHYLEEKIDRVYLIYNEFKSALQQNVVVEQLLPIVPDEDAERLPSDGIFEPSETQILNSVLPRFVNVQLWRVLLESFAAEMAARMTAMENATQNAGELIDSLTLHYNKARQAAITGEILEVVSGAEGLK